MEPSSIHAGEQRQSLIERYFTRVPGTDHELAWDDGIDWTTRTARAGDFVQEGVEAPDFWSDNAVGVTAKLYFATVGGVREHSVREMIRRVARKITDEGAMHGYFGEDGNDPARDVFYDELCYLLVHQMAAFNTPVWLNVGVPGRPQCCSACFLLRVEDSMFNGEHSITRWWDTEARIFKMGAGSGINASALRGSMEPLSTGGLASGPTAYIRASDAAAGTLKSGGAHRRAAKMVILDADHPDIIDFVQSKPREDRRMRVLAEAGEDLDPFTVSGEKGIAECTSFQNENQSVAASDDFMRGATDPTLWPSNWNLYERTTGNSVETIKAPDLLLEIAEATWQCGDPGMVFPNAVNRMHTTPSLGPITTCNPCLVGKTLIDTSEGRMRIDYLAEQWATGEPLPLVFAFDLETNLPVLRRIRKAWMTKWARELVEVETDKGVKVRCTPDHRFLLRDGRYVEASSLKPGDRLRKIGRWVNEQRSNRRYLNHRTTETSVNGTVCQSRFMWEQAFGPIPEGMEIHHLNEDPADDRLGNFELRDERTHQSFHSSGERNGRFLHVSDATLIEVYEEAKYLGRFGARPTSWNRAVHQLGLKGVVPIVVHGRIRGQTWAEFETWAEDNLSLVNDVVATVRSFDASEPVYDLSVEGTENFAVATEGVEHTIIVHNCGETWLNDDSSCNLASLNLRKFQHPDGGLEVEKMRHAVDVMVLAMDITCSFSDLPTEAIERNTRELRQLGLGYANLGAFLMVAGLPYDSSEGRDAAGAITALMTGRAYLRSAEIASQMGPYARFEENRDAHLGVIELHRQALRSDPDTELWAKAREDWASAAALGEHYGFRNSQATVVAPTGTTSLMMDCDTSGCEPEFSLTKHKGLAGGGAMEFVNQSALVALDRLGYSAGWAQDMLQLGVEKLMEGLDPEHRPIFACANDISAEGHVGMVAAIQPFLSGAPSKTVNLPESATVEDIVGLYSLAWRLGCKAVSVYRDGSKATQVLSHKKKEPAVARTTDSDSSDLERGERVQGDFTKSPPQRKNLPRTRQAVNHKMTVGDHKAYITAGKQPDGTLGEIFVTGAGKEGSFVQGMWAAVGKVTSIALQYGVPLEAIVHQLAFDEFEPRGATGNPDIPEAHSMVDYAFRWLASEFLDIDEQEALGILTPEIKARMTARLDAQDHFDGVVEGAQWEDSPVIFQQKSALFEALGVKDSVKRFSTNGGTPQQRGTRSCGSCGGLMYATGTCFTCSSCGSNTGCG